MIKSCRKWAQIAAARLRSVTFGFALICATPALAQQAPPEDVGTLVHYAYAPLLGTGWYEIGDQSAFIFSIPAGYEWRETSSEEIGIYFRLPVAIGLYNFDLDDIPDLRADDIATVSFLPGVEFRYSLRDNWMLKPFVSGGWGTDLSSDNSAWIYALGVSSLTDFQINRLTLSLGLEYLQSGYNPDIGSSDFINRIGAGVNLKIPLDRRIGDGDASLIPYAIAYHYTNELQFPTGRSLTQGFETETFDVREEYELGITFGRDPGVKIMGIEFDRIGIGYRFGDNLNAVVLVGSFPF